MSKNTRHKTKGKDYKKYEYYISNTETYECEDSFFVNQKCPFYNLITDEYFVIDDRCECDSVSHSIEKRPIAEYCDYINDYFFNCMSCKMCQV